MLTARDFSGVWQLERTITDALNPHAGRFAGMATFAADDAGALAYLETGTLHYGDAAPMVATRRYRWLFATTGVAVQFADGAPFHSFVPDGHAAGTDHPCGADFYQVRYDFTCWPQWRATWAVKGPRKNYVSVSHYARAVG